VLDVAFDSLAPERRQPMVAAHALVDLPHFRQLQFGVELGLADKHDLQAAVGGEGVGKNPRLLD
jgi:hypothetical protein